MHKRERQQKILEIIKGKNYVSAVHLSKLLYVSLPTVRRDLTELSKNGLILRNHGGAMSLSEGSYEIPLDFRSNYNMNEKINMCRKAAKLICDGDIIFIDASTSTMHIADFITSKKITVVTNGMPAAIQLARKGIKTFFTGGEILVQSLGSGGSFAETIAASFNYNIAFFSSYGINEKRIIVDTSLPETSLRKTVFKNSQKKVFLYTKSKEGLSAPYNVIALDDVDEVITDD